LHSFVLLCETNILNLINQYLDNYYQIKTKLLRSSTVNRAAPIRASKRGRTYLQTGAEAPICGHLSRVLVSVVLDRVVPVPVLLLPPPVVTEDV
jgi:hypothetical protein